MDISEYLKNYIGKIVVFHYRQSTISGSSFPAWKKSRDLYLYDGEIKNQNLREILPNELIIEFDNIKFTDEELKQSQKIQIIKEESRKWINKVKEVFIGANKTFHITDHDGLSPHLRIQIQGLEKKNENERSEYKIELIKRLLDQLKFKSDIVEIDWSLIKSKSKVIPLENTPHWKEKHNGNIVKVVFSHPGEDMVINEELVKEIIKKLNYSESKDNAVSFSSLQYEQLEYDLLINFMRDNYRSGIRNKLCLALAGQCKRVSFTKKETHQLFKQIFNDIGCSYEYEERQKEINYTYDESDSVAVYYFIEQAFPENTTEIYHQFMQPFERAAKYDNEVELPVNDRTITDFAQDIVPFFANQGNIYYKANEGKVVEISSYHDKLLRKDVMRFNEVDAKRLLNIIDEQVRTFIITSNKDGIQKKYKSMNEQLAKLLLANSFFLDGLRTVNRFLNYPLFFEDTQGKLIIPSRGFDERFQAFFTKDTPLISDITLEEAKNIIEEIIGDFCFKEEIDKHIAIAYLITPACRGLYSRITCRTPIFLIKANRERAGKDYLAGVVGCVYEGQGIDDTPISTGGKDGNNNEELRKKLTSAIKNGRRRFHSANNKGNINNAVLEQFTTSETWRDRELGRNHELILDNEVEVSLSANMGITYTPDFWYRTRVINLFYEEEDPNKREFKHPNLHDYVIKNRGKILSAIYKLIQNWWDAGKPKLAQPFTSYTEWAKIVGNVLVFNGYGDPCAQLQDDDIGGDSTTKDMKLLFTKLAEKQLINGFLVSEIIEIVNFEKNTEDFFVGYDTLSRSGQIKFGKLIHKFNGRVLNDIKMLCVDQTVRTSRQRFIYKYIGQSGNVGNVGNSNPPANEIENDKYNCKYIATGETLQTLPTLPKLKELFEKRKEWSKSDLDTELGEKVVKKLQTEGVIYESSKDCFRKVF